MHRKVIWKIGELSAVCCISRYARFVVFPDSSCRCKKSLGSLLIYAFRFATFG